MNTLFYIVINEQQHGPFTIDELKAKNINKNTLVWTEGLSDWTKAEYIPLLKDILKTNPPPIPKQGEKSHTQHIPPTPNTNSSQHFFGYTLARRRDRFMALLVESIIISIPIIFIYSTFFTDSLQNDDYAYFSIESIQETIAWAILSAVLAAVFYPMWSGNLGHKIMGLKVISSVDGSDQNNAVNGALREALKTILSLLIFPVIWLLWDDDRQNLYDKAMKTYVVKKQG